MRFSYFFCNGESMRKVVRCMKLTFFILLLACLQVSAHVDAQNMFTLNMSNVRINKVLNVIQKESNYRFFYNERYLRHLNPVTVKVKKATLSEVMDLLLDGKLGYKVIDNNLVVISPDNGWISQQHKVEGTVTDTKGTPLVGVTVKVKGTSQGTVTDANGNFTLLVPDSGILEVSYIGYETQEIAIGDQTDITIQMKATASGLNEVVVVGYGTQKKKNLTGAVETVGSEVFENRSAPNTTQALQGAIPNLNLSLEDGKPTRSASYNVRGTTSIGQGGHALVLIDGVEGDPSSLNPNDIESVTVLKDAASAAIYGARGAFGVVLITTKKPQKGKTIITYSGNYSIQSQAMEPKYVTDAVTWLEHFRLAYYNNSRTVPTSINNGMQYFNDAWLDRMKQWKESGAAPKTEVLANGDYEYYTNTDWMDLLFKDHTFTMDHNLTVSGGNDKSGFYLSGRYYDFGGIYNYDPDKYRSYNLRAKAYLQAFKWLKISNNLVFSKETYHMPYTAAGRSANVQRYIEVSSFPSIPLYNPDGTFTRSAANTLGSFIEGNNYQNDKWNLFKNTTAFNASFFNNTFRVNGNYTFRYNTHDYFWKRVKIPYHRNINNLEYRGDLNGTIKEWVGHTMYTASNLYAEYENTFAEKHHVKAMVGWNYETSSYKANSIQRNNLLLESAQSIQLATGTSIIPGASVTNWKTAGGFFRVNYGYRDRYLLEVNGRYDGSSRFPTDQQWGFFPSISGGWRVSEEPFWNVNQNLFSDVKFRVSYGSLGNGNISPYQFLELLGISTSGRVLDGSLPIKTGAPDPIPNGLTWETATTTNFGLDFGMLKGKLRFNGDYYIRKTTDMYVPGPTLPDIFGADSPKGNFAEMTTRGFEISLKWQDQFTVGNKPFTYHINANLYDYVSTIDKFNNPTKRFTDYYNGMTIGELWGFETDGLFQEDPDPAEYVNTIFKSSADAVWRAGDLKIRNRDGSADNQITKGEQTVSNPGDMTIIGNTEPRYQYGFTIGAEWNGLFFSAFFHGVGKQDWYPGKESAFWGQYNRGYNQMPAWQLGNYWTEDNPNAYLPRYSQYNGATGYSGNVPNDRYLQNVSFLRLRNVQIGYTLPTTVASKVGLRNIRIYVSGENLISWSPLYKVTKDFMDVASMTGNTDSDLNSNYNQGSGNVYPLLKTISFGLSLTY